MNKILIVEDDLTIREGIRDFLEGKNYVVDVAEDGAEALLKVKSAPPDLVVLDLGLPKITGESVCREIKREHPNIGVIVLTAKTQSKDVVEGFRIGADDYIGKPFELEELASRVKARLKENDDEKIQIDDLVLDNSSVSVVRGDKKIRLSPHEFKLLHYLMSNKGRVLSREMILNRVWQYSYDVDSRVVDVYIGYLRKKIDGDEKKKKLLNSVRGFGYSISE